MTETLIAEGSYDIADVATRTGLSAHALRYYERGGLVHAPQRDLEHIDWKIDLYRKATS